MMPMMIGQKGSQKTSAAKLTGATMTTTRTLLLERLESAASSDDDKSPTSTPMTTEWKIHLWQVKLIQ